MAILPVAAGVPGAAQVEAGSATMEGVVCPSATFCQPWSGNQTYPVTVSGTTLSVGTPIPAVGASPGIGLQLACASASSCDSLALTSQGDVAIQPISAGVSAAPLALSSPPPPYPGPFGAGLEGISCPSSCYSIYGTDIEFNGSYKPVAILAAMPSNPSASPVPTTWSVLTAPPSWGVSFDALTCPTSSDCLAVGSLSLQNENGAWITTDGLIAALSNGAVDYSVVPATPELNAVACATVSACVAVGQIGPTKAEETDGVVVPIWDGQAGVPEDVSTSSTQVLTLLSVACPTAELCEAVGFPSSLVDIPMTTAVPDSAFFGGGNPIAGQLVNCQAGDPVDCATGNLTEAVNGFTIPGMGVPLSFGLTYNSLADGTSSVVGFGWTTPYNMSLQISQSAGLAPSATVVAGDGSTVTFTDTGGSYAAPTWAQATLTANSNGTYTFYDARHLLTYVFSSSGAWLSVTDRNGWSTSATYNSAGQMVAVTDPEGRQLTFSYNSAGQLASVTDPSGRQVLMGYDSAGDLTSFTNAGGGVTGFTYDGSHDLLTATDPRGGTTTNTYNESQQVISQKDPLGRTTTFAYQDGSTLMTDPNGNETLETFTDGEPTTIVRDYDGNSPSTWTYTYDPTTMGLTSETNPDHDMTGWQLDPAGDILTETTPLGETTTFTYNGLNEITSETDPDGDTTTYNYDGLGNLLSTSSPLAGTADVATTTYTYSTTVPGQVVAVTDPDGNKTTYTYDQYGDEASSTNAAGDETTWQYNGIGQLLTEVSPQGNVSGGSPSQHTTSYTYNALGQVLTVTDPLGQVTTDTYDGDGNLTATEDPSGTTTSTTYDARNEITKVSEIGSTGGTESSTSYTYDGDGNRLTQSDAAGDTTQYTYSPFNQVIQILQPTGSGTGYSYDPAGELEQIASAAGSVTGYSYNADGDVLGVTYSSSPSADTDFTYDGDGQRLTMKDGTGTTTYTWDSLHRLTSETNGAGKKVTYAYDLDGNLTSIVYPGSVGSVTRTYNSAGELAGVEDWLGHSTTFAYTSDGDLSSATYPDGVVGTYGYNADDAVTSISDKVGSKSLLALAYDYSSTGQVTTEGSAVVTYDPAERVASSTLSGSAITYSYDSSFRPLGSTAGSAASTFAYNGDSELTSVATGAGATTYGYDSVGDRTAITPPSGTKTTYSYDQLGRLTGISGPGASASYAYNGDGLRMSKTVSGSKQQFTWDTAEGEPLLLAAGSTYYVEGPGGPPLEQISGKTVRYYLADALGSTRDLVSSTGAIVDRYTYDAYGNVTASTGTVANPFEFAGAYKDAESGFYYLGSRYYDPATEQFITSDPLTSITDEPYTYAGDDPVNLDDPTGQGYALPFGLCLNLPGGSTACQSFATDVVNSPAWAAAQGVASSLSFGITTDIDEWAGAGPDVCSQQYQVGELAGFGLGILLLGPADFAGDATEAGATVSESDLPAEAQAALNNVRDGGPLPYSQDGQPFANNEGLLPQESDGYYSEYTVETPGATSRGLQRLVIGNNGEVYYTGDHYQSFLRVTP